jgi:hypothetical protein
VGEPAELGPPQNWRSGCSVPGCERKHYGRGLCRPHYNQAMSRAYAEAFQREQQRKTEGTK